MESDVIVVGGGVIGLTTAIVLAESAQRVRVWSRDPAGDTTSAVAGGLCWPYRIEPEEQAVTWSLHSFHVLSELAEAPDETGVRLVAGTMADTSGWDMGRWGESVPGLRAARAEELPDGYEAGFHARTPLVDMRAHLPYLERRLAAAGGVLERRVAVSLDEAGREASFVVNCTGLGARDLVPDPDVRPVQGQLVVVENPGIDQWFVAAGGGAEETTYILPQPYGVILGGTAREGAWDLTPDPGTAEAIVRRCARCHRGLAEARVLEHRVGLRPFRSRVRLEVERLPGGALCVHNYGHGGAGITVSWGCAEEAAWLIVAGGEATRRPTGGRPG
ncbi:FAD-dependent oxidoreductase [Streptomyces sp. NPDC004647]|uniref:FAD-dependent oxidoreductase n=1 Tax=Streptomyces sp. NPDC004647 TaxID=3154671 RepID=UPI0033AB6262